MGIEEVPIISFRQIVDFHSLRHGSIIYSCHGQLSTEGRPDARPALDDQPDVLPLSPTFVILCVPARELALLPCPATNATLGRQGGPCWEVWREGVGYLSHAA